MQEVTQKKIDAANEEVASIKPQVQNYTVEPDPENIENDDIASSKNDSENVFLKEGTPIEVIT